MDSPLYLRPIYLYPTIGYSEKHPSPTDISVTAGSLFFQGTAIDV